MRNPDHPGCLFYYKRKCGDVFWREGRPHVNFPPYQTFWEQCCFISKLLNALKWSSFARNSRWLLLPHVRLSQHAESGLRVRRQVLIVQLASRAHVRYKREVNPIQLTTYLLTFIECRIYFTSICKYVPGLSKLLLPRVNPFLLVGFADLFSLIGTYCLLQMGSSYIIDTYAGILIALMSIGTMLPFAIYTGRILLQSTPSHLVTQLDKR